ncbi:MAG: hypothetical protein GY933_03175 [Hyphomicrobiales bacterium]|nr:hypothetical protein [Hyphomicrobiales bacterium]
MEQSSASTADYQLADLRAIKPSRPLSNILTNCALSADPDGVAKLTPRSLFYSMLTDEKHSETARSAFGDLFDPDRLEKSSLLCYPVANGPDTPVSTGLYRVFQGALSLRSTTGGKDSYIGRRHILFALMGNLREPFLSEMDAVLADVGVDRVRAQKAIAAYCLEYAEPQESQDAWDEILASMDLSRYHLADDGPELRPDEVAVLQSDDPWDENVVDRAGAGKEAEAFAAMICARQFAPPLAVGVFGDWGSGKSFFMKLVYQAINRRTQEARQDASGEDGSDEGISFLKHIVQIRFNAWHYAETNLWASLVDHIFNSLDDWANAHNSVPETEKIFKKLTTARKLTVEAVEVLVGRRKEKIAAADTLKQAEAKLAEKRSELERQPGTFAETAWKHVFASDDNKAAMQDAAKTLGLGEIGNKAEELGATVKSMDTELARFEVLRSGTIRALATLPVIGLVVAGIIVLPPVLGWAANAFHENLSPVLAGISGIVAPVIIALSWAAGHTNRAVGVVHNFRDAFEKQIEHQSEEQLKQREIARKELDKAQEAAALARQKLSTAVDKVQKAAKAYEDRTGKGRVLRFVRDRVIGGEYSKQLSFAATVRKDFEELSRLMTADEEPAEAEKDRALLKKQIEKIIRNNRKHLKESEIANLREMVATPNQPDAVFERIVLCIDDLDRCPPNQVINVLQAIHLLLTFPLFVVFVAVDVRWLHKSLTTEYQGLLGKGDNTDGAATASDYLEKIIQIPYWVRHMDSDAAKQILRDRMGRAEPDPDSPDEREDKIRLTDPATGPDGSVADEADAAQPDASSRATATQTTNGPPAPPVPMVSLDLTKAEREFIESAADALNGSPRRTLRFINSYRIIKASLNASERQDLEAGGYAVLATLLIISVTADDAYPVLYRHIRAAKDGDFVSLIDLMIDNHTISKKVSERAQFAFVEANRVGGNWNEVRHYAGIVARFAFNTAIRSDDKTSG